MDTLQKKSKSPAVFLAIAFFIIVVIMFIANRRILVVEEIRFPLNNGVAKLSTSGNLLVAISNDNRIYAWDWTDLSRKPRVSTVGSTQAVLAASGNVVSLKKSNPSCVIVSGLDDGKIYKEIIAPISSNLGYLCANRDGTSIVVLLAQNNGKNNGTRFYLFNVLIDAGKVQPIVTIDSEQSKVRHLSVSDAGNYIVAAGEKNGQGWMLAVDVKERQLKWKKELPNIKQIYKAVFSRDEKTIYARGTDCTLILTKTDSGEITDRLLPTEENSSTYGVQAIQTAKVSNDGSQVAAMIIKSIYIWDTKTKESFYLGGTGHKVMSGIAFSPDTRFLATSDMRQGGTIEIMRMPRDR